MKKPLEDKRYERRDLHIVLCMMTTTHKVLVLEGTCADFFHTVYINLMSFGDVTLGSKYYETQTP